jgi:hypothetical protein
MVRRRRHAGWPLWISLAAHGLLALLLTRGNARPPAPRAPVTVELEITTSRPAEAPAPAAPVEAPAVRRPATPGPRRPVAPAPSAPRPPAASPPAAPSISWLSMRSPGDDRATIDLNARPQGEAGPAGDALGVPSSPIPDVTHRPPSQRVQPGVHRTASGLEVRIATDGTITFRAPGAVRNVHPTLFPNGLVGVSGSFDVNDAIERAAGNDPYSAEKRQIAEATREDRLCLAQAAARQRKQESLFHLKERLEHLVTLAEMSDARRRELVFEMWDECLDDTADGEPDLGAAARATIVAFIRRAFPPDSARGYPPTELASLNRRRTSRHPFAPYGN